MDLIGRYIFRQTGSALAMILLTLTLIVWMTMALRQLSVVTSHGQSFVIFLKITALAMPSLIIMVAPIALLISAIHTLNRLNGDSEVIVLSAAGATIWRILRPYMLIALLLSLLVFVTNAYLMPKSAQLLRDYIVQIRTDLISQVLQPGNFSTPEKGLTFHIRDRDHNGDLLGLMVHDERDPEAVMTYLAERGQIIEQEGRSLMIMQVGHIHRQNGGESDVQIVSFDSYLFDISEFGPKQGKTNYKPSERYLSELLHPDINDPYYKYHAGKFRAELHERLTNPLYPILFVLIAAVHLGYPRTTRDGRAESIVGAFGTAALLRGAGVAATNLAAKEAWAVALMYGIPVIGIVWMLAMATFNIKPLSLSQLSFVRLRLGGAK